ncbi:MAG: tRNA lysidine(34) synthetase TilS, partial [Bacteroidota bacterium]|nr:tRNA lysidine(34) synthetase TilS [Bacteroidota bacterium]
GLEGLTGMPEEKKEVHCLRPMLALKRNDIEAFARLNGLEWVEDSSNNTSKHTRNFFRNEIIPQLQKVYPQAEENLLNNIKRFGQTAMLYNELVRGLKKKICTVKADEIHIPVLKLMKYKDSSLIYEIIRDFGFGQKAVDEVIKLADAESGKYIANDQYRVIRHRRWFIISPITTNAEIFVIEKEDEVVIFGSQQLQIKKIGIEKFSLNQSELVAQMDAGKIEYPLLLRKWKTGDYFYPLGMQKKKKLSRFFIDKKFSKPEKEKVWVLESHKRIVWVVGQRIDDRAKITEATKQVLQLSLSNV